MFFCYSEIPWTVRTLKGILYASILYISPAAEPSSIIGRNNKYIKGRCALKKAEWKEIPLMAAAGYLGMEEPCARPRQPRSGYSHLLFHTKSHPDPENRCHQNKYISMKHISTVKTFNKNIPIPF